MKLRMIGACVITTATMLAISSPAAAAARWFDATTGQLAATGWRVDDTSGTNWAQARRAAHEFCIVRGGVGGWGRHRFVGGLLNGHQRGNRRGVICTDVRGARWFDATTGQLLHTGWPVGDTSTTNWAQAARAAHGFCTERQFVGGFLNGHQRGNRRGVICVNARDAQWFDATTGQLLDTGWPVGDTSTTNWAQAGRAAHEFCVDRSFVGGFLNGHQRGNRRGVICLR